MVTILSNRSKNVNKYILDCMSTSGVSGAKLRKAHYYLGLELGQEISSIRLLVKKKVAILIMMRAGLPFGLGLADALDDDNDVDILFSPVQNPSFDDYDLVIVADAVINTGKTILSLIKKMDKSKTIIAVNVISEKNITHFEEIDIYSVRVSPNSYIGSNVKVAFEGKGPDTGDRLFCNYFSTR